MLGLPYPSFAVRRCDVHRCVIDNRCPFCGSVVGYSGGYWICCDCECQMPNFPESDKT